jgi:glycosyltransferase involved in cell wall biosynthesis
MNKPIRVLHVVVNMNRGGAETLIMNLYRNIDRSKVQFDFLTCREGVFDREILELGGIVHRIPYITEVGHFKYIKALNQFFSKHTYYHIVHSHMNQMSGIVLTAAKKSNIPVRIAHSHSTRSGGGILAKIYRNYAGALIRGSATNYLACSTDAAKWLFGASKQDIPIINNGIEIEKFIYSNEVRKNVRNELEINTDTLVIGHVGRFTFEKNHDFLIQVFSELIKIKQNTFLLLVGDGQYKTYIERKIKDSNLLNKVKFLGVRDDVNRILQAVDLFLFPSIYEGLPVTLIEAQGAGLPCIISDSITKEVDLGVGLINYLNIDDVQSWVEKIQELEHETSRFISVTKISEKGYNVRDTAERILQIYSAIMR